MTGWSQVKQAVRKVAGRPGPKLLSVKASARLTPNMIRITLEGPDLDGFPEGREGGNCKLMLPEPNETRESFANRLLHGPAPVRRTFTVRHYRSIEQELDIDFVAHGDNGPASSWATHAIPGDFIGFMGPSAPKLTHFDADWFLVAADLSALPMAAATLESMPTNAKGVAVFEVPSHDDKQTLIAPKGIEMHWLIHPDTQTPSVQQSNFIRSLEWPDGRVQTCIAGESGVIKQVRQYLVNEKQVAGRDLYVSGYWKIGMVEDQHQQYKRTEG